MLPTLSYATGLRDPGVQAKFARNADARACFHGDISSRVEGFPRFIPGSGQVLESAACAGRGFTT